MIPGGATLIFDVELINIGDSGPTTNVFKEIDNNGDKQLSREEVVEYVCLCGVLHPCLFLRKTNQEHKCFGLI